MDFAKLASPKQRVAIVCSSQREWAILCTSLYRRLSYRGNVARRASVQVWAHQEDHYYYLGSKHSLPGYLCRPFWKHSIFLASRIHLRPCCIYWPSVGKFFANSTSVFKNVVCKDRKDFLRRKWKMRHVSYRAKALGSNFMLTAWTSSRIGAEISMRATIFKETPPQRH